MRKLKLAACTGLLFLGMSRVQSQSSFPVNGLADPREKCYAFTHATIVQDPSTTIEDAALVIRKGRITALGKNVSIPVDAIVLDCKGKYIYPSFIDIYSNYGIKGPEQQRGGFDFRAPAQLTSNTKGAFGWNQAIKPETEASDLFTIDEKAAKLYREAGFGTVLTHNTDGIARGTGMLVSLAGTADNFVVLKEEASANYSFSRGSSRQSYPSSMMGSIALLRQTYLDASWYKSKPADEGVNMSLEAWNRTQSLPQIFDAGDKWNDLRADRIGDEFGVQYIIKGGGNEYQRIDDMKATNATFILPLDFPKAMDVEDPNAARFVSLADMKHWEMAPSNPAALEKAGIRFCITSDGLKTPAEFMAALRKAIEYGLTEKTAMEALTTVPAQLLGVSDNVGSLQTGKWANLLITSGPIFDEKTTIYYNFIQGNEYGVKEDEWSTIDGVYTLNVPGMSPYTLEVKGGKNASVIGTDTLASKFSYNGKLVTIAFAPTKKAKAQLRLSGTVSDGHWFGNGVDTAGKSFTWTADFRNELPKQEERRGMKKDEPVTMGKLTYPLEAYGWEEMPKQETILIKNATVWTNEAEGKLENTDVLVQNGKIAKIGKNLSAAGAREFDATGKFLTPGIIDEHSHIAASSINEGGQSVTSEVRIGDNLDPDDINIYRQLSGGVTSSHILHGSANTIGGQTQLIKLRWGTDDQGLKFAGADPFIKFALGENVKRTTSSSNNRFPDTRMGVEEVLMDAFTRARNYEDAMKLAAANSKKKGAQPMVVRRDLELDALVEIMNRQRFITCHSYVQTEIVSTMRVAEKFGFRVNTFTHILEGYKVADKMKAHGANASTFSDWWAYKMEVQDAIAYNAYIMQQVGLNVCINSDDAEMARRLNQEAAKSMKYGGMSEEEAFKMVTLNPAKALHIEDRVGSIKVGKDADLVIWTANPLSIYAKAQTTIVDGTVYFDRDRDLQLRQQIQAERNRLISKMLSEKKAGRPTGPARPSFREVLSCGEDHGHKLGLLEYSDEEEDQNGSY